MQNDQCTIFHEPFGNAFYFGPEKRSSRYQDDEGSLTSDTYGSITASMLDVEGQFAFSKDMAYYVQPSDLQGQLLTSYQHTFLIRAPTRTVPSLYKHSVDPALVGWSYFDPQEVGMKQLLALFLHVKERTGKTPVVIDSDDLLADPAHVLHLYCTHVGFPYSDSMLTWRDADLSLWSTWGPWHTKAMRSSGFSRSISGEHPISIDEHPWEVQQAILDNMEAYLKLKQYCISTPPQPPTSRDPLQGRASSSKLAVNS